MATDSSTHAQVQLSSHSGDLGMEACKLRPKVASQNDFPKPGDLVKIYSRHVKKYGEWVDAVVCAPFQPFAREPPIPELTVYVQYEIGQQHHRKWMHVDSADLRIVHESKSDAADEKEDVHATLHAGMEDSEVTRQLSLFFSGSGVLPSGYFLDEDGTYIIHATTGVRCWAKTLKVAFGSYDIVLYHYAPKEAVEAIIACQTLNASTRLNTDCDFGVGQYATAKPPHVFGSKLEILQNNYPRTMANFAPDDPGFPKDDRVASCIPILVDSRSTPAYPLTDPNGPCGAIREVEDRYGPFDPYNHNIWVIDAMKTDPRLVGCSDQQVAALHLAVQQGQADVVQLCLAAGTPVDVMDPQRRTPLWKAAQRGRSEILRILICARAYVDACSEYGDTCLMVATREGKLECVKALLSADVSVHATDPLGRTAATFAEMLNRHDIAKALHDASCPGL